MTWFIISYSSLLYLICKGCSPFTGKTFKKIILFLMYHSANIKRRHHKKEDEVEKIINSDPDSKKQGQLLTLLRFQQNHMYNLQSRRMERGELFIERKMAGQISIKDIGPCPACKAWMGRDVIWQHQQSCKANPSVQLLSTALVTQSDTIAQCISPAASKKLVQEVFSKMRENEVRFWLGRNRSSLGWEINC